MESVGDKAFVSDIIEIQGYIVRGLLMRSYWLSQNKAGWLTPSLCKFIIKTYSSIIAAILQKNYGLNALEEATIMILIACYIAKKVQSLPNGIPNPGFLFDFIGNDKKFITDVVKDNDSYISSDYDLVTMCKAIAANGPARLQHFDVHYLYQHCENLLSRDFSSIIAIEYPPYWVYHLLLNGSGTMSRITSIMRQKRLDRELTKFAQDLNTSRTFIPDIEDSL